ncbi:kinesin-domain-containing protein [Mytilinidion resinicola]|uniref:Kinesin-domain-containing protein n=1 Tax=Mytilinidion resinicola TaxID=574789 RepID=A0A6A6Z4M2_9PEZI|nr:kinesin-domain-containing protein [Mytilinidion resinicola]KAF2815125.1 kinesin-domain-containing protein [Mytilinidion resinicola]
MSGLPRGVHPPKKVPTMRPSTRPPLNMRGRSGTPALNGRASPTDSVASFATNASRARSPATSQVGGKRKERDFENDGGEETNINVVVRCRGRNDREVRENSGVVVSTDGIKGKTVGLSMGPSALSNKTYSFDKVFSPAADQGIIFDEVVAPILDEVLSGFNCTIFAYGQTGTGKTYTMSGDISDMLPQPDAAGIIPRALYSLFNKLESEDSEHSVKCSFIELYNEELRDLLSPDDGVKLKIYEDNSKKGHSSTMVQGVEESHIKSAAKGIQLLREGSHKRQVAATKCNDLSSRSHTVFTVTIYIKRTSDTGEDFISAGKLNLVDLAGSENIQRSGAENKRAAEAGLINKSLLTLGRVINALVERGSHIPYRESKLTRLLQDSLGGRTKTCIIATLSPAKSNLEETISTLDYAFRAKNIRNKPQINQMVSKKTLLREFTGEIEKLKSELIATRQRNGVYLTQESYEEIMTESESRRILSEEQRDKIETMEVNLRNKVQELFSLTSSFNSMKKDNDATKLVLEGTKSLLEKTEVVLAHTRQNLADETTMRRAHEKTEEELVTIGHDLISALGKTTTDIGGLHSKLRRRSDLQSENRKHWTSTQSEVSETTLVVENRIAEFQAQQDQLMQTLAFRMQGFVQDELLKLGTSQAFLQEKVKSFESSKTEVNEQTAKARDDMNEVLEEIKTLREDVKEKVGAGLDDLSAAAQKISAGIVTELDAFHTQLHSSYIGLGRDFKDTFTDLIKHLHEQQAEADQLRQQIVQADTALLAANTSAQGRLSQIIEEEKLKAAEERQNLLTQMTSLINSTAEAQESRFAGKMLNVNESIDSSHAAYHITHNAYNQGMDNWVGKSKDIIGGVTKSRDNVKAKIKADFSAANDHTTSLRNTTTSVHDSTVEIVSAQKAHMDTQLHSLDEIVSRVRAQNNSHHAAHTSSLGSLAANVQSSYSSIDEHFSTSFDRVKELDTDMASHTSALQSMLPQLASDAEIRAPLRDLRAGIEDQTLFEYVPTGETPQRMQYAFPSTLPRTEPHDSLLSRLRGRPESGSDSNRSPTKGMVFNDPVSSPTELIGSNLFAASTNIRPSSATSAGTAPSLRELDVNIVTGDLSTSASASTLATPSELDKVSMPPLKRQNTNAGVIDGGISKLPMKSMNKKGTRKTVAGAGMGPGVGDRENLPVVNFSASVGPGRRRLRSHEN